MASQSESSQLSDIEMDAAIEQFCSVTGADSDAAHIALDGANWNVQMAVKEYNEANDDAVEDHDDHDNRGNDESVNEVSDQINDDNDDNDVNDGNDVNDIADDNDDNDVTDVNDVNDVADDNEDAIQSNTTDTVTQTKSQVGELIANIFGDSDDSDAEFEGFVGSKSSDDNNETNKVSQENDDSNEDNEDSNQDNKDNNQDNQDSQEVVPDMSSDEEDGDEPKRRLQDDIVYDFDLMLQRKREENYRRRKRKNIDIINDNDDVIAEMIQQMKTAADDDFELNKNRMTATRKLKMLPVVVAQLRKLDLREAFLDAGVLGVITDWLTRLPDGSLPHLQIRSNMLKILGEFNIDDVDRIKASGIGKAVMYLMKHPKETKENKKHAAHLIACWSRPIFNLDTDFHSMTKDEREKRDFEHMTKTKRMRAESTSESEATPTRTKASEEKNLRPGDKGWIPRARVPLPSMKDYVVRPKSNIEAEINRGSSSKRLVGRIDKHMRNFREKKKMTKTQRAVPISIEGRKMAL